jgi:urease beta subunit
MVANAGLRVVQNTSLFKLLEINNRLVLSAGRLFAF